MLCILNLMLLWDIKKPKEKKEIKITLVAESFALMIYQE